MEGKSKLDNKSSKHILVLRIFEKIFHLVEEKGEVDESRYRSLRGNNACSHGCKSFFHIFTTNSSAKAMVKQSFFDEVNSTSHLQTLRKKLLTRKPHAYPILADSVDYPINRAYCDYVRC